MDRVVTTFSRALCLRMALVGALLLAFLSVSGRGWTAPKKIALRARFAESSTAADRAYQERQVEEAVRDAVSFCPDLELVQPRISWAGIEACGSDGACLSRELEKAGLDAAILAYVDLQPNPPTYRAQLLDAGTGMILGSVFETLRRRTVKEVVFEQTLALIEVSGIVVGGKIIVETDPRDAAIGLASGAFPLVGDTFTVPPGRHVVVGVSSGYADAAVPVVVGRGERKTVQVAMEPSHFYHSPWFWVGVGIVVVAGAVTTGVLLSRDETDPCPSSRLDCR